MSTKIKEISTNEVVKEFFALFTNIIDKIIETTHKIHRKIIT